MKKTSHAGVKGIRAAFADAARAIEGRKFDPGPELGVEREGVFPGAWDGAPWDKLPPGCPVQVIGHKGDLTYAVSAAGELHEVSSWDRATLFRLFAPCINYLYWAWPRFGKPQPEKRYPINGLEVDKCVACLVSEAARKGLFDPKDKHRGRGGWADRQGRFLWHSGEYMWTVEGGRLRCAHPGEYDGQLYTRQPDIQQPWPEPVDFRDTPATQLLKDFSTWSWERSYFDPIVLIGWIACAYMGGALKWRPTIFTTGGAGVGKSTLHSVIQGIFDTSLHATADTTAAGIYQRVRQDSLPVSVDELEAKPGSGKASAVIELARLAASGARLYRGGADHEGVDFRAQNCFIFSAINPPPMHAQDKTRMAILSLGKLDRDRMAGMNITISDSDGRMLLRQVMDGFDEFNKRILPDWKATLHEAGLDSRAQDTYGTLLAAAELLLGPEAMEEAGLPVADQPQLGAIIKEATELDRAEQTENWQACLEHLMGSTIEAWRTGEKPTVGGVLADLAGGSHLDLTNARARLSLAGLGLRDSGDVCHGYALAVPAKGPALARLFEGTQWEKGVWHSALKQGPPNIVMRDKDNKQAVKINGVTHRCLLIDLEAFDKLTSTPS